MRLVQFVQDVDAYKAGDVAEVDDQLACNAIAMGAAVPSIGEATVAPAEAVAEPVAEPVAVVETAPVDQAEQADPAPAEAA